MAFIGKSTSKTYNKKDETFCIPLASNFLESLYETTHGNLVQVKPYRPRSVNTVHRYADHPVVAEDHIHGKPTKASILGNMKRIQSANNICSRDSWIKENKRLCQVRYYYEESKPKDIRPRVKSSRLESIRFQNFLKGNQSRDNLCYEQSIITKQQMSDASKSTSKDIRIDALKFNPKNIRHQGVNTDKTFYSLTQWHGAEWQTKLPRMYLPRQEKYDAYKSTPIRMKNVTARFRDSSEMTHVTK